MRRSLPLFVVLSLSSACVGSEDNPANVHDLRVLAIQTSPPELMSPTCGLSPQALFAFSQPVTVTALVQDPAGGGRSISWDLFACAWPGDRTCEKPEDRVRLARGETGPGELVIPNLVLGAAYLEGRQQLLLQQVFEQDQFKGLGGLRMPLVLHVRAGEESIHAQKLAVFSCQFFPEMKVNVQPVLPGMQVDGQVLGENDRPVLTGQSSYAFEPLDFADLQESYVVPAFDLSRVPLEERWRISWHADVGFFSPGETGGVDFAGQESRHTVSWLPPPSNPGDPEREVHIWAVVRDGRGGQSWLSRTFRWKP